MQSRSSQPAPGRRPEDGLRPCAAERARTVAAAADDPAELARLGVGWVLVERGTPGRPVPAEVDSTNSTDDPTCRVTPPVNLLSPPTTA